MSTRRNKNRNLQSDIPIYDRQMIIINKIRTWQINQITKIASKSRKPHSSRPAETRAWLGAGEGGGRSVVSVLFNLLVEWTRRSVGLVAEPLLPAFNFPTFSRLLLHSVICFLLVLTTAALRNVIPFLFCLYFLYFFPLSYFLQSFIRVLIKQVNFLA